MASLNITSFYGQAIVLSYLKHQSMYWQDGSLRTFLDIIRALGKILALLLLLSLSGYWFFSHSSTPRAAFFPLRKLGPLPLLHLTRVGTL